MPKWLNMLKHFDIEEAKDFTYKGEYIYPLLSVYQFFWKENVPFKSVPEKEKRFRKILSKLISIKRYWEQKGEDGWELFLKFVKNGGDREIENLYDQILKEKFIKAIEKRFQADYPFVKVGDKEYTVHLVWNDEKQKWEAFLIAEKEKVIKNQPLGKFLQTLGTLNA